MIPKIAVLVSDASGRITWTNAFFPVLTGWEHSQVSGLKPGSFLQGPGTDSQTISRLRQAIAQGIPIKETLVNYRANGEAYTCMVAIYPIRNKTNQITDFIGFSVDVADMPSGRKVPVMELEEKYRSSALQGIKEARLYDRLIALFEEEAIFLNAELSLHQVAELLNSNVKYLSQVINRLAGLNFQGFVNDFRMQVVRKKIADPMLAHLTFYGIAMQCGFRNKSTFYKVFKENMGITPRKFTQGDTH